MTSHNEAIIRKGFWKECLLWIVSFIFFLLLGIDSWAAYFMFGSTVLFMFDNAKNKRVSKVTLFLTLSAIVMSAVEFIYKYYF